MIGDATYQKVVKTMHVIIFIRFCSMRKVLQRGTGGSLLSIFLAYGITLHFKNDRLNFHVQYPDDWTVSEEYIHPVGYI